MHRPWLRIAVALIVLAGAAQAETLRLAVTAMPIQMGNPFRSTGVPNVFTMSAIYDALTNMDADGVPRPWLATEWQAETPTTWVFRLRPGVAFSNGAPCDAAAVVASARYLLSPEAAADLVASDFKNVAAVEARDPLTVVFRLKSPDALFPRIVTLLNVIEPKAWAALGREAYAQAPVGTGPFQVTGWSKAGGKLAAVKTSWRAPKVDGLEILALPDATSRVQGLLSGRIDIAMALGPDDRDIVTGGGHRLVAYPIGGVMGFAFIATRAGSPVADVRVRRALNYAVDKQAIVDGLLGGVGAVSGQPAAHAVFGFDPAVAPYPFDPAKAKALLAEAGYGQGLSLVAEVVPGTIAADAQVFAQVAADLARVGVTLTIRATTFPTFSRHYRQGDWEGDAQGMYYNADPTLDALRAIKMHRCEWQPAWYCDPQASPGIAAALAAPDVDSRRRLTQAVMARYHDQASALFLHELSGYVGVAARVEGFRIAHNFLYLHEMRLRAK
jgi:peptide/nickel transport system substrate-binding protein